MTKTLDNIRKKTNKWQFVIVFGILFFVSQMTIAIMLYELGTMQVLLLQVSLSADSFGSIIKEWNHAALLSVYKKHFYLDFLHPIWYSLFLASFISKTFHLNNTNHKYNYLLLLPFVAGLLDIIENILHLYILSNLNDISKVVVLISGITSNIKWLLVFISIVIILQMLVTYLITKRKNTKKL